MSRGYARRVLKRAISRIQVGDAALSLLYDIARFSPNFGYATVEQQISGYGSPTYPPMLRCPLGAPSGHSSSAAW